MTEARAGRGSYGGGSWRRWRVAVTGVNSKVENPGPGRPVARCLKESEEFEGELISLGYDVLDAGLYDRGLFDGGYLLPYPAAGERALLERIEEIHSRTPLDAIIPCLDAELPNFVRLRQRIESMGIRMLIPGRDGLKARSKDYLYSLCERLKVAAPETRIVSDPRFFRFCDEEGWRFPLVVKGVFYDAYVVYTADEAVNAFSSLAARWGYPVIVQKFVAGTEVNLVAVGDGRGTMEGAVMMRKRGITDKGKAWAGVTVHDDELEELSARLVDMLCWEGPLEVEAMRGEDGKLYIIEINPRFPAWVYLSAGVGRNLPLALLKMLAGEAPLDFPPLAAGKLFIRHAEELIVDISDFESVLVAGEMAGTRKAVGCALSERAEL